LQQISGMRIFRLFLLIVGFYSLIFFSTIKQSTAQDTLKVMYYNVLNYPGSIPQRVSYFRTTNQYIRADVILISELINDAGAETLLQDGLNVYGAANYQKAVFTDGYDTDNMLFYNSNKLALYSQDTINTALRQINEYILYYKSWDLGSTGDTIFLYFYSAHLKASTGSTNENKRFAEITEFKNHLDSKPNAKNIFFGGDLNLYKDYEPAYDAIINYGTHHLNDPLPAGYWHDHEEFSSIHTQSTRTSQFGGGASGGIDDRFDFIFFSDDVINGINKVSYIPNSCIAVGNDGNHFNKALIDSPVNTSIPDSVTNAIYYMSDHMPVLCKVLIESSTVPLVRELAIKTYLEGAFNGNDMSTGISNLIPHSQSYNTAPWYYYGTEKAINIPDNAVDWVLVELHDIPNAESAGTSTIFMRRAAFLLNDGSVVDVDGSSVLSFNHSITQSLFVTVRHRNHLDVLSAYPAIETEGIYIYDFTTSVSQAYMSGEKLVNEKAVLFAGDANGDGDIDSADNSIWENQAGIQGYKTGDFDLNGQINNSDKNELFIINIGEKSYVPE